jgi:hypothetical protein
LTGSTDALDWFFANTQVDVLKDWNPLTEQVN